MEVGRRFLKGCDEDERWEDKRFIVWNDECYGIIKEGYRRGKYKCLRRDEDGRREFNEGRKLWSVRLRK